MQLFVTQFQKDSVISFMLLKYKELEEKKVTSLLHINMLHFLAVTAKVNRRSMKSCVPHIGDLPYHQRLSKTVFQCAPYVSFL